ncbi:MAG: molybdopterin-guanine dinucleotide biosynthesis protein B [Rhodospirillales bacterium]|nr:molybdopterin-guanine dinucleotide biosynthesis protein B [Rhodospirillales bacterium]MDE0381239.1 molybdopterin-guanine dinucleotide biosynthesis protein B [Rhodospirillales bacterium]
MRRFGVTGLSDSGKTTLVCRLLPRLRARGLRVATVKHAHHGFDLLPAGHPAHAWRAAGAKDIVLAAPDRHAHLRETGDDGEPPLDRLLESVASADLVLIEGYKRGGHDKIEVRRGPGDAPLLAASDPTVVAIASDRPVPEAAALGHPVPVFPIDDVAAIASFVAAHCGAGDSRDSEAIRGAA